MSSARRRMRHQQEQLLMMQAASNPSMFFFIGDMPNLERKLQQAMERGVPITDIFIRVTGIQINELSIGLLMLTIMLGTFCIFPLFAMCYDCWKKSVYPTYELPLSAYQKLQYIIATQFVRTIHLEVADNNFNRQKAQLLYQYLSVSSAQTLMFANIVTNLDFKENEYSEFEQNMKPIKMLPIQSVLRWWTKIVV